MNFVRSFKKTNPNKPNLLDAQMNVTSLITVDYENKSNCKLCENKPNTNPIKPNFRKAKMNIALYSETNYERKGLYGCRKNKPKQTQFKLEAQRRPLRVSFLESSNRGPIKPNFKRANIPDSVETELMKYSWIALTHLNAIMCCFTAESQALNTLDICPMASLSSHLYGRAPCDSSPDDPADLTLRNTVW